MNPARDEEEEERKTEDERGVYLLRGESYALLCGREDVLEHDLAIFNLHHCSQGAQLRSWVSRVSSVVICVGWKVSGV